MSNNITKVIINRKYENPKKYKTYDVSLKYLYDVTYVFENGDVRHESHVYQEDIDNYRKQGTLIK